MTLYRLTGAPPYFRLPDGPHTPRPQLVSRAGQSGTWSVIRGAEKKRPLGKVFVVYNYHEGWRESEERSRAVVGPMVEALEDGHRVFEVTKLADCSAAMPKVTPDVIFISLYSEEDVRAAFAFEAEVREKFPLIRFVFQGDKLISRSAREQHPFIHFVSADLETEDLVVVAKRVIQQQAAEVEMVKKAQDQAAAAQIVLFIAGLVHDMNNILGANMAYLELLKRAATGLLAQCGTLGKKHWLNKGLKEIIESLEEIDEGQERLRKMLATVLSFSKTSSQTGMIDVNQSIDNTLTLMAATLRKRMIVLSVELSEASFIMVGQPQEFERAIVNLVSNAMQAIGSAGGEIKITSGRKEVEGKDHIIVEVADNGSGIPEEHISHILEPFYTTKDGCGGTGLGLSQVNSWVVEQMGGEILIESEVGAGTKFTLMFPVKRRS